MKLFVKISKGVLAVLVFSMIGTIATSANTNVAGYSVMDINEHPMAANYPGNSQSEVCVIDKFCYPDWTGRWLITYLREGDGHWVTWCQLYVPDFVDNELDAKEWRWSDEYIAENCSLIDEPQTWEGMYLHIQRETILECAPLRELT